jgi:saccharopine dehydrogenase-like NADP-dependent oxidoreductase
MKKKILIVGGYGNVGGVIARQLGGQFPGNIIVAGRDYKKASAFSAELNGAVIPAAFDISKMSTGLELLDDVGIVIMCLDQTTSEFVRHCFRRGIDYIDISASGRFLSAVEELHEEAIEGGATGVLSVGIAPGLTNLLTKYCQSRVPGMAYADIFILLGLGDAHGEAAIRWTIDNVDTEFEIQDAGKSRRVKSFREGRKTAFSGGFGERTAFRFNFSDQQVLPKTLGLKGVSTRLCFDSALISYLFAVSNRIGLSKLFALQGVKDLLVGVLKRLRLGSDEFVIKVEGGRRSEEKANYACSLRGAEEGRITGLVAAKVAQKLSISSFPSGVFHIEQLFEPPEFLDSLGNHGMVFEEQEFA